LPFAWKGTWKRKKSGILAVVGEEKGEGRITKLNVNLHHAKKNLKAARMKLKSTKGDLGENQA